MTRFAARAQPGRALPARRTPARRLPERTKPMPRWQKSLLRLGFLLTCGAAVFFGGRALVMGGWPERQGERLQVATVSLLAKAGLSVREVWVDGRARTAPSELLTALKVSVGEPVLGLDLSAALARVEALPWVARAQLSRELPGTLRLTLQERVPLALWQHQQTIRLIDTAGLPIAIGDIGDFRQLPLLVGATAPEHAAALIAQIAAHPAVAQQFYAAQRVSERRWDLRLRNGLTVRLPAEDEAAALKRLQQLLTQEELPTSKIVAIDLRLPDRMVLQTREALLPVVKERI